MAELQIKPGTKLQMAFDVPMGQKTDFNMMATFKEAIDDAYFLVSVPMLAGKPLLLDENQKFLMQYSVGDNTFMIAGYPEAVEKVGIRTFWKMRQVAEQRTFFKRRDERFKVSMRLEYQRDNVDNPETEDAMTIDVSAGGVAIYLNDYPDVGEALQVQMPTIRLQGERHELPVQLGIVCWVRQAPKGSLYRNVCGLQFRYADDIERETVKEYMEYVRAKYKM
ncbi:PilZ domain-containing protein [Senegalimassilia faecalis]|uniref:PilZ domain-containing protein n=1 Tax=Senegalimassilia faecalis TaxID=2509433 RepID=A0A4Q2K3C4_9ACTN|nr:PilZ domain-containing protein [Senegalimassilia faecalis]RXZ54561.1 PilZ domain-containing protein [Senegalimassilia faecalis]